MEYTQHRKRFRRRRRHPTIRGSLEIGCSEKPRIPAMVWAQEKGVVTSTALRENDGCTRADVVRYLWRLAGSPSAGGSTFRDVSASAPYAQAVSWAVSQGVTTGLSSTSFDPANTCTRGQIVTFLYRWLGK